MDYDNPFGIGHPKWARLCQYEKSDYRKDASKANHRIDCEDVTTKDR